MTLPSVPQGSPLRAFADWVDAEPPQVNHLDYMAGYRHSDVREGRVTREQRAEQLAKLYEAKEAQYAARDEWRKGYEPARQRYGAAIAVAREVEPTFWRGPSFWQWLENRVQEGEAALRSGEVEFTDEERTAIQDFAREYMEILRRVA